MYACVLLLVLCMYNHFCGKKTLLKQAYKMSDRLDGNINLFLLSN